MHGDRWPLSPTRAPAALLRDAQSAVLASGAGGAGARVTEAALARALHVSPETCHADSVAALSDITHRAFRARLEELTVLDPACGSGAFLVYALERLAALRRATGDARGVSEIRREV